MQPTSLELLVSGLALLIIGGGIVTGVTIVRRCRAAVALVAYQPRRRVPWSAIDLFAILLTYLVSHFVVIQGMLALDGGAAEKAVVEVEAFADSPQKMAVVLVANAIANVLTAVLAIALVRSRCGADAADLGLSMRRLAGDIKHGAAAFSLVLVPIYLLQALLARFFTTQHPIVDLLEQSPQIWLLVVAGLAAVIVAPLV